MEGYFKAGEASEFPLSETPKCKPIPLPNSSKRLNLITTSKSIMATSNACPHKGAPFHQGTIKDIEDTVTCLLHNWTFSLKTGKSDRNDHVIDIHDVIVKDGILWISIDPVNQKVQGTRKRLQELVYNPSMGWI
jgi:nitrite reductase/ring-hydroxylating ferredoxin subunit